MVLWICETRPDGQAKCGPIWVVGSDGELPFQLM